MSKKIKLKRVELEMKQKILAEKVGISVQYLNSIENGRVTNVRRETMIKIATELKSTPQELFF